MFERVVPAMVAWIRGTDALHRTWLPALLTRMTAAMRTATPAAGSTAAAEPASARAHHEGHPTALSPRQQQQVCSGAS